MSLLLAGTMAPGSARADGSPAPPAPIRFLLTFDDGPRGDADNNSTALVLDTLASNAVQSGIKAIFFVQTRASSGGGTEIGRQLLKREFDEGHELALHTSTPHHTDHRYLSQAAFETSLRDGEDDLRAITGAAPTLVRPPFWNYDAVTLATYHRYGMQMMLTDLSANDGKIYGVNFSWHKRSNMLKHLAELRPQWASGALPVVDGVTPIVVTFHDINSYTARHVEEYLQILVDVAKELEMPTAPQPFYTERSQLESAALSRAIPDGDIKHPLPGIWNWLWQ